VVTYRDGIDDKVIEIKNEKITLSFWGGGGLTSVGDKKLIGHILMESVLKQASETWTTKTVYNNSYSQ
jgi:hypothetical protein